jgi:hypothetical protein
MSGQSCHITNKYIRQAEIPGVTAQLMAGGPEFGFAKVSVPDWASLPEPIGCIISWDALSGG